MFGAPGTRCLGALTVQLTPERTVLVRYQASSSPPARPLPWERGVEIAIGSLCLQVHGVHLGEETLLYARLGSRAINALEAISGDIIPCPGVEITLVAADASVRSSITSKNGQTIFQLFPGLFALILPLQGGGELKIEWL